MVVELRVLTCVCGLKCIYYSLILENPRGRGLEGIGESRGGRVCLRRGKAGWGLRGRKVLKIYKSVHIKPKRSTTKGWCRWVGIFDKV